MITDKIPCISCVFQLEILSLPRKSTTHQILHNVKYCTLYVSSSDNQLLNNPVIIT